MRGSTAVLLACSLTLACVSTERARAEEYPARPVRIIVPNEPGGAYDFVGRLLAHELSPRLGQSVYVENRPGAGSVTGTQAAASAPANGYTLLVGGLSNIVFNAALYRNLPYDPARDLVPVALVNSFPYVLVARKGLPAADLGGVIDAARKQPDALTIGVPGAGSAPHILGVAVMKTAGVRLVEVPYKGIQAPLTDLLGERVDLVIASEGAALPYLKAGQLKGIASAGARRTRYAPDLPTMQELGLPLKMEAWLGLFAPAATPADMLARLRVELRAAAPELKRRLEASGTESVDLAPDETLAFVRSEHQLWTNLIRDAGIRLD
jgi:tripartite-type tricarboxylate transporter receptor subunit TctC